MNQSSELAMPIEGRRTNRTGSRKWLPLQLLEKSANDWNISKGVMLVIFSLPFIVVLAGFATAFLGKNYYKWFTRECGFAESLQVAFYLIAFIIGIMVTRELFRSGQNTMGILYIFVCFGLFFLCGEEINWGQNIFAWQTPEAYTSINKQNETNIHNIYGVGFAFKWIQLLVGAYGTLLPLILFKYMSSKRQQDTINLMVPHFSLVLFFAPLFVWKIYRNLFAVPQKYYYTIAEFNEVMELIFSIGVALFMIFQIKKIMDRQKSKLYGISAT